MSHPVVFCVQVHRAHSGSQAHPGKDLPPCSVRSLVSQPQGHLPRLSGGPASASCGPASCLLYFAHRVALLILHVRPQCPQLWLERQVSVPPEPLAVGHLKPCD